MAIGGGGYGVFIYYGPPHFLNRCPAWSKSGPGRQVIMNVLHPGCARPPRWSPPVFSVNENSNCDWGTRRFRRRKNTARWVVTETPHERQLQSTFACSQPHSSGAHSKQSVAYLRHPSFQRSRETLKLQDWTLTDECVGS